MRFVLTVLTVVVVELLSLPGFLKAQLVQEFNPPKAGCCLQFTAQQLADELQDWNQLGRYHQDDLRLAAEPPALGR